MPGARRESDASSEDMVLHHIPYNMIVDKLIGLAFGLATFPGIIINAFVQQYYFDKYSVPVVRVLSDEEPEAEALSEMSEAELSKTLEETFRSSEHNQVTDGGTYETADFTAIDDYADLLRVAAIPFIAATIITTVCYLLALPGGLARLTTFWQILLFWLPLWIGFSVAAHSFPHSEIVSALWERSRTTDSPLRAIGYPFVAISWVANFLRSYWLDAIYGVVIFIVILRILGLEWVG